MRPGSVVRQVIAGPALLASVGPGSRVLDLAGYDGSVSAGLESRGAEVVVLDLDQSGLLKARSAGLAAVRASAARLPFESGAFDVVLCMDMLNALPEELEEPVMREIRRVLKDGGTLCVTVVDADFNLPFCDQRLLWEQWKARPGYRFDRLEHLLSCAGAEVLSHRRFYGWPTRLFYALFYHFNIPSRGYRLKAWLWPRIVGIERAWCPAPRAHLVIARPAAPAEAPHPTAAPAEAPHPTAAPADARQMPGR